MERVAIYLRKSRSDLETEMNEKEDTLSKHRRSLLKFANERSLNVICIYEEVVSGERIQNRPEMQRLLQDVENGEYQAVLVMDMDRLGRGNMQEQGYIIDTFRDSGTLIITPRKTYDLRNEFDEEYSEFEAFMARKELKIITRRLQSGRKRSVEEGAYIASYAPYGYQTVIIGKKRKLIKHELESEIVALIFEWYRNGIGVADIVKKLNDRQITFHGKPFSRTPIYRILKNKSYTGITEWRKTIWKPHKEPGKKHLIRKRDENEIIRVENTHEPIVTVQRFEEVQLMMKEKTMPPVRKSYPLNNPLSGILKCGLCGSAMIRHASSHQKKENYMRCDKRCGNVSIKLSIIEDAVVKEMTAYMEQFKIKLEPKKEEVHKTNYSAIIKQLQKEIDTLTRQKNNLHNLLEQNIYSIEMYLERSNILAKEIKDKEDAILNMKQEWEQEHKKKKTRKEFFPALINVLKLYHKI
jgi:DNA invertase Pin-like site-specific DNA recombinase